MKAANDVVGMSLNVRETEKLVKKMQNTKQNKEKDESWREKDQLVYDQAEENLKIIFGTKVAIHRKIRIRDRFRLIIILLKIWIESWILSMNRIA